MEHVREYFRRMMEGPIVRPFGLAGPILVLLIALPLLRPLRHPNETEISSDESLRLASVKALVEHRSLTLDKGFARVPGAVVLNGQVFSRQPPMMAILLWPAAWTMTRLGFSFESNPLFIEYGLTLLGCALPAALAAALIYRMGRMFELKRPWRTLLAFSTVAGSGLLSYAVVLNAHVPAATLVIASAACLVHVGSVERNQWTSGWLALAGASAALAATLDPPAVLFLILFLFVIPALRLSALRRTAGVAIYILGAIPVLSIHSAWNAPITGDMIPASVHAALQNSGAPPTVWVHDELDEDQPPGQPVWNAIGQHLLWLGGAAFGSHGLISHFPVLIVAIFGVFAVMHRHWPGSTKILAGATGVASLVIIELYRIARFDWASAMFASQWFVIFTPMLLFWSGAWLRRRHSALKLSLAGLAMVFSVLVGIVGATGPMPRRAFRGYTATDALSQWVYSPPGSNSALAGRKP
ncbi:MAG TPA: hypothetical protein VHD56_01950 [Tepidisphaeraceae bacterium]|nr:hypothetical protein [Tepidisphaeraceae bacterium]